VERLFIEAQLERLSDRERVTPPSPFFLADLFEAPPQQMPRCRMLAAGLDCAPQVPEGLSHVPRLQGTAALLTPEVGAPARFGIPIDPGRSALRRAVLRESGCSRVLVLFHRAPSMVFVTIAREPP